MTCDPRVFVCIVASGCTFASSDEPVLVVVKTPAASPVELVSPAQDGVSFHWEIVEAPDDSVAAQPAPTAITRFTPDRRGTYHLERSIVIGAARDVTHLYVVEASPVRPIPLVVPERPTARVGDIVVLDASPSYSPEGWPLTYQWSMRFRPGPGPLLSAVGPTFSFPADAAGSWGITLTANDGQLIGVANLTVSVSSN